MAYPELCMIIDGERIPVGHRRTHTVINPATLERLGELPLADAADLDRALDAAARGFATWRKSTPEQRSAVLLGAASIMAARAEDIARVATAEQGKTLAEARTEVAMNVNLFRFYAGECHRLYGRSLVRPAGSRSIVTKEPIGPVVAFSPWNFPINNPGRKLGAPIAAGCSVILKSAEEAPASALLVLESLLEAGLPKDVAQAVFGIPDEVSRHLLASPIVRKLSFTGSTQVGKHLLKLAADDFKRTTMELGGHGAVLVFKDAKVEKVLDTVVAHKFRNAGQVCVAPTRFIIEDAIYDEFVDGFAGRAAALKIGNGADSGSQMGPMANARRLDAMDQLIGDAKARGAQVRAGGERIGNRGFFFQPTVITDVPLDADIMNTEPFGPVAICNPYGSEDEMVAEANRLPYGLAAYLWTDDAKRQRRLSREIETGMLGINTSKIGGADAPFGGVKWSGHGHEDGLEGVEACLVTKAIHEE